PRLPPISLPGHQTPDRSGWPSAVRGTACARALFAGVAVPPVCAAAKLNAAGANHTRAVAAAIIDAIKTRFIFETLLQTGASRFSDYRVSGAVSDPKSPYTFPSAVTSSLNIPIF